MIVICLGHFLVDLMLGIWPVYKTIAHLDLALAGVIGGVCAFAGEGMQILFGSLSDRGFRKLMILIGLIATTASAYFAYTFDYLYLTLLYMMTCAGSGAFHPAAVSFVSDLPSERKGLLIALFAASGAFGMSISQLAFTQSHYWFAGHVVWLALPAILLVLFLAFSRIGSQPAPKDNSPKHLDFKIFALFFRQKPLRMLYISQICNATMLWGTMFLLPDLLSSRGYEPWISFGGGHLMFIIGSACMMIPAGYLADRYSSRTVIMAAAITSLFVFYALLFSPLLNNTMTLILLFLTGACIGVVNPVSIALGTRFAPFHKASVSAFLMGLVWCVSEGMGQLGGGLLATCFDNDAPAKALAILGSMFLLGFFAAFNLPKTEQSVIPEYAQG